jgi:hypothetical protein
MKYSNDIIWNRTRDLTACRAVPQPTAPPRAVVVVVCYCLITYYLRTDSGCVIFSARNLRVSHRRHVYNRELPILHTWCVRHLHTTPDMPSSNGVLAVTIRKQYTRKLFAATTVLFHSLQ